jgi:hypothetical protein
MKQSDEQLYELVAKELATSPRQGLLIKCMAKSDGEENKGKALYIETRVDEMKVDIAEGIKKQKAEEKEAIKKAMEEAEEKGQIQRKEEFGLVIIMVIGGVAMGLAFLFFE